MRLKHTETETSEPRYDSATLQKVIGLAGRLQNERQEKMTVQEIEDIGTEVGVEPTFIRQALAKLTREKPAMATRRPKPLARAWWAGGWTLPFIGIPFGMMVDPSTPGPSLLSFFLGWGVYIGTGVFLSHSENAGRPETEFSRAALLDQLFTLQHQLESHKQHRAFLSVDVAGSSAMKQNAPELAVEYSFVQFRSWVEEVVRACGGEMHSAAGDGLMCHFFTDRDAVRAARRLQEEIPRFNAEKNRLPLPFRIRCGISTGDVPIEAGTPLGYIQSVVIDRAAALQKAADAGDIVISAGAAEVALAELGTLSSLPEPILGAPAFSWRAGQRSKAPPALGDEKASRST